MRLQLTEAAAGVLERVLPPDPGRVRRLAALRATLAGVLSFVAVMLLGRVAPLPHSDLILAFAIALFTGATVRDPDKRQQAATIALVPLVGFSSTMVASFLIDREREAGLAIAGIAFAATYGGSRGPRAAALGIIALIAFVVGLVTQLPPETLPWRAAVLCVAAASAALFRFVVLPDDARAEMFHLRRDIRIGMSRVLKAVGEAVAAGSWSRPALRRLRRRLDRLAAMMLMAQTRIASIQSPPPGLGLHLLDLELAIERVGRLARHDLGLPTERPALCRDVAVLAAALQADHVPPPVRESAAPLTHALAVLAAMIGRVPDRAPAPIPVSAPAAAGSGLRPAAQAAVAVLLAVVAGQLVSPNRWYWAAFAAFVIFQGTRSRGESIRKAAQFMGGTVAGVVAGVLVAVLLSGHDLATIAAILIAVFLAFQASQAAYGAMVFWITIILALLFGMLGYFPPELLLLRLKETAVGAGSGLLVASAVMARPSRVVTDSATAAMCRAIGAAVDAAVRSMLGVATDPALPGALVALEGRFSDLREAARPELAGLGAMRRLELQRRMVLLSACHGWSRELGRIALHATARDDPAFAPIARPVTARICARVAWLAEGSPHGDLGPPVATATLPVPGGRDTPAQRAIRLLMRIEFALEHLEETTPKSDRG